MVESTRFTALCLSSLCLSHIFFFVVGFFIARKKIVLQDRENSGAPKKNGKMARPMGTLDIE